ncbi:MAG TPA: sulfotransferase [Gemmatimonadales bacterium]|nr:sulfotransferase [Gemmatimonadales bacterium]
MRHLPWFVKGHPLHGLERYQPFFIVGSGRCGSTLLRAILESHREVHIPPENVLLGSTIGAYRTYSRLPWPALLSIVLGQLSFHQQWDAFELPLGPVFRELVATDPQNRNLAFVLDTVYRAHLRHHKPSARRWGDKSAFSVLSLEQLKSVFPDLQVIHLVRDGRDVVSSFLEAFKVDYQDAAETWIRAVTAAEAFGARYPKQYVRVRYEDLVRVPESTVRQITRFLALDFDEQLLRHERLGLRFGDVERTPYMQGVREPIHGRSVGKWRSGLTGAQAAYLERTLGSTLSRFGYDLDGSP